MNERIKVEEKKMSIEAMKQALEALEEINQLSIGKNAICLPAEIDTAMDALRQAIEQAEKQEPVAWWDGLNDDSEQSFIYHQDKRYFRQEAFPVALYTAPPRKEWVGLTADEVPHPYKKDGIFIEGWLWAEAKLKERNT